jgi:hypothetical protein
MRAREPDADGFVDRDGEAEAPPFQEPSTSTEDWAKYNRHYWLEHWPDFATGGDLVVLEGAGPIFLARDPVTVNLLVREFVQRLPSGRRP